MSDPRIELAQLAPAANGETVLQMLDSIELVVEAPSERTHSISDQAALYNLVNQVSRLFAHVTIAVTTDAPSVLPLFARKSFADVLGDLRHDLELTPAAGLGPSGKLYLAWGMNPSGEGFAGDGAGWSYSVGRQHIALTDRHDDIALGGLASSSFLAAKALVSTLAPLGLAFYDGPGFVANLLDYSLTPAPEVDSTILGLGYVVLCGCGSVGSSLIYCAALAGVDDGELELVDDDFFKERNTFRYPVLRSANNEVKVAWLDAVAKCLGLDARPHKGSVDDFLDEFSEPPALPLAAVSVDTVDGRRQATDLLARTTLNAGVLGLKLHLARHGFGESGCAYCQYVDVDPPLTASAALAEQTGLSVERVAELELSGKVLEEHDVQVIAAAGRLVGNLPEVGDRLADLRRRVYAQAAVPMTSGEVLVAAPFVSTLAGLLMLVESVKEANPNLHRWRLQGRLDLDLTGEPTGFVSSTVRDSSGRCLCYSPHRRRAYSDLHAA